MSGCVPVSGRCDGVLQCADGSDERGCAGDSCATLGAGALRCAHAQACYLPAWRCDNVTDCPDHSDEADCDRGELSPHYWAMRMSDSSISRYPSFNVPCCQLHFVEDAFVAWRKNIPHINKK